MKALSKLENHDYAYSGPIDEDPLKRDIGQAMLCKTGTAEAGKSDRSGFQIIVI